MSGTPTLVFYRTALAARVVGSLLLAGGMILGVVFAELTFRSESLHCQPPQHGAAACQHVRSWPFVASRETPLSPVVAARTRAGASRGGGTNVTLLLEHADRTVSEYAGVGALGVRAEPVALQMNDHLAGGRHPAMFLLRDANEAFGIGLLLVFCVLPSALFPGLYGRVRVFGRPSPRVEVGRGVLPARRLTSEQGTPPEVAIETRVVGGNTVYVLRVLGGGTAVDLTSLSGAEACRALGERVRAALEERS